MGRVGIGIGGAGYVRIVSRFCLGVFDRPANITILLQQLGRFGCECRERYLSEVVARMTLPAVIGTCAAIRCHWLATRYFFLLTPQSEDCFEE
jgi:hypothetical protein